MKNKNLKLLITRVREITATDDYSMDFFPGATEEEIVSFENTNNILFPHLVKDWLRFADGACLFDTLVMFYGVTHGKRIIIQNDGYIRIGIFNYGDTICIKSNSKKIYLCAETVIEYTDFAELLALIINIGTGDDANE